MESKTLESIAISIEDHPEWYLDIPVMKTLILGSYPPHYNKWDYKFYYPNKQNRFWKILADLRGVTLTDYPPLDNRHVKERYTIMKELSAGVQNMGLKIERKGKSARDTDIKIIKFQNILSIIKSHSELNRILLPGFSAPSSTLRSFVKYLKEENIDVPDFGKPVPGETVFPIVVFDKKISCHVLNSTSTAARVKYQNVFMQFKNALA